MKVLLYAYAVGVAASRQMARELEEDVAFRVLAANQRPDIRTISDFRTQHLAALTTLFVQVLRLCQRAGLVKLGHIALDGTKLQANASKHKAMSYDRMVTVSFRKDVAYALAREAMVRHAHCPYSFVQPIHGSGFSRRGAVRFFLPNISAVR